MGYASQNKERTNILAGENVSRGRTEGTVTPVHIKLIDYIWARKPGQRHPEIVTWYNEFETLLREGRFSAVPQNTAPASQNLQTHLWDSLRALHRDMTDEMRRKGSVCIVDGMREPLSVILMPTGVYLPRMGNQRLCVLRAADFGNPDCSCHGGTVPCIVLPK